MYIYDSSWAVQMRETPAKTINWPPFFFMFFSSYLKKVKFASLNILFVAYMLEENKKGKSFLLALSLFIWQFIIDLRKICNHVLLQARFLVKIISKCCNFFTWFLFSARVIIVSQHRNWIWSWKHRWQFSLWVNI